MKSADCWLDEIQTFFECVQESLAAILEAEACREGWLQAEMFRYFRPKFEGFAVNSFSLVGRARADFGCDAPNPIRGEIKVLGGGYQSKVITGGSLAPYLARAEARVHRQDRDLLRGTWGLIPDYFRLRDAALAEGTARALVLVAHLDEDANTGVAAALRRIDFDGRRRDVAFAPGFVRIWVLN